MSKSPTSPLLIDKFWESVPPAWRQTRSQIRRNAVEKFQSRRMVGAGARNLFEEIVLAARFEFPEAQLQQRKNLIISIEEIDGKVFEIAENQPAK